MKKNILMSAILMLVTTGALAADNNGIVHEPFTWTIAPEDAFYVPCINDWVYGEETYDMIFHVFTTPSGVTHVVASVEGTVNYTSLSSGHTWVGHAVQPYGFNYKPFANTETEWLPGVDQLNFMYRAMPLEDGDPGWSYMNRYKITVNAKGDLVMQRVWSDDEQAYKCFKAGK